MEQQKWLTWSKYNYDKNDDLNYAGPIGLMAWQVEISWNMALYFPKQKFISEYSWRTSQGFKLHT